MGDRVGKGEERGQEAGKRQETKWSSRKSSLSAVLGSVSVFKSRGALSRAQESVLESVACITYYRLKKKSGKR